MALWRISRIEYKPAVGPGNPSAVVTLIDKDSGLVKVEENLTPPGILGVTVEDFLCTLELTRGYDPNDFGVSCAA
jgi:hypothetical protein